MVTPGRATSGSVIDAFHDGSDEISWAYRRILEFGPVVAEHTGKTRRAFHAGSEAGAMNDRFVRWSQRVDATLYLRRKKWSG
jgi:hypothetical protein